MKRLFRCVARLPAKYIIILCVITLGLLIGKIFIRQLLGVQVFNFGDKEANKFSFLKESENGAVHEMQRLIFLRTKRQTKPGHEADANVVELFPAVYGDDRFIMTKTKPINAIPRILHFMWNTDKIPKDAVDNILAWKKLHPDWIFMFWSKQDVDSAMKRLLSGKLLCTFILLPEHIMQLDYSRYAILFFYGGVYADIDVRPLRSLEPLLQYHTAIIAREPEAYSVSLGYQSTILAGNFLMASQPGHPFWPFLMRSISKRISKDVVRRAGPVAVDDALRMYKDDMKLAPRTASVFFAPSMYFYPPVIEKGDHAHLVMLKRECPKPLVHRNGAWFPRFICETLKKDKRIDWSFGYKYPRYFNVSFTKHLQFGDYLDFNKRKKRQYVPLDSLPLKLSPYVNLLKPHPPLGDAYNLADYLVKRLEDGKV